MSSKYIKYGKTRRLKRGDDILHFDKLVKTHKIDGTNARICFDPDQDELRFGSRNRILTKDSDNYGFCKWGDEHVDKEPFHEHFPNVEQVVVFGEWFGSSIQGRIDYPEEKQFCVFDVFVHSKFVDWEDVVDISEKLGFCVVPHKTISSLGYVGSFDYFKKTVVEGDYKDPFSVGDRNTGEGVVIRPPVEVVSPRSGRYGERLLRKVKSKKFEEVNSKNSSSKNKEEKFDDEELEKVKKYINENRVFSVVSEISEKDPEFRAVRENTGDVIKETIRDIQEESEKDLDDRVLGKYGGSKIASIYHEMIEEGKF